MILEFSSWLPWRVPGRSTIWRTPNRVLNLPTTGTILTCEWIVCIAGYAQTVQLNLYVQRWYWLSWWGGITRIFLMSFTLFSFEHIFRHWRHWLWIMDDGVSICITLILRRNLVSTRCVELTAAGMGVKVSISASWFRSAKHYELKHTF